jgi:uncharacterized protein involved in outer membrane biogenesis
MSVFRRAGLVAAAVFGVLMILVAAVPYVVDADAFKPALVRAVKEATGRELVIEGPLKLSMFPEPRISARQVHFANALGAAGAQMLDVRWIGASPSWSALLRGRLEVGRLVLYQPTIILETDADGVPNWQFKPGAGASQAAGAPASGFHLAVGSLKIVRGTLSYTNPRTRRTIKAEEIEAVASVGSLEGPFSLSGTAKLNGAPLTLDFKLGAAGPAGHATMLAVGLPSGKLDFTGTVSKVSPDADVKGHLVVSTAGLTDFVAALVGATGQAVPAFDTAVAGRFAFDGGIDVSATRFAVTDFKMSMDEETATGSLVVEQGKGPTLRGQLSLPKVDLEKWLALMPRLGDMVATPPAISGQKPPAPSTGQAAPSLLSRLPPGTDVSLVIVAAELAYRKGTVRDLAVAVEIHDGTVVVPQFKAVLPGEMVLQATAKAMPAAATAKAADPGVQATGEISLSGTRLRETLAWLQIDTASVPATGLQAFALRGKLAATAGGAQLTDLAIELDGQRATGSASVTVAAPLSSAVTLQLDRFDLDKYLPAERQAVSPPAPADTKGATPATLVPAAPAPPDKGDPIVALTLKVKNLVLRQQSLTGVDADATLQGNLLKVASLKVADLVGAKLDLQGSVSDVATAPRYDLTFNLAAPDADRLFAYAGLPKLVNGRIGALSASGGAVGNRDMLMLRNATVSALGSTARATGTLVPGASFGFDFSSFAIEMSEAGSILAAVTGQAQAAIGALSAAGAFKGDASQVAFNGTVTAFGTQMIGQIGAANLKARPNVTANLRVPGTLDLDQWLGVSAGPTASPGAAGPAVPLPPHQQRSATGKAIDLAALRAFDAALTLETSAVAVASVQINYADLQASLRNGVFKIAKLTGQFYGGAVDFSGTIDSTKSALDVDLAGSLQGIYLGEMLRGGAGTNVFGNDNLMVSVDGKITIMDIVLRGRGASFEEIRNSLAGKGQVSGYIYPSVTAGSLGFASFATGIASVFSTEMGFSSAVLAAFINQKVTLEGELQLASGTVTLRNHKVQGGNAVAQINSNTSLTTAATETTIALDVGRSGTVDYTMTVTGPVSSPAMTVRNGN